MERVRSCLSTAGFADVRTHIQSGNVRVSTPRRSASAVAAAIEPALAAEFGFEVPTIVRRPAELSELVAQLDELASPLSPLARKYVVFCRQRPGPAAAVELAGWAAAGEAALVLGSQVVIWLDIPAHQAKLTTARLERIVGGVGTARDVKVVRALSEKWGA